MNHRYVRTTTPDAFDALVDDLRAGRRDAEVPPHGTLVRVRRSVGLSVGDDELAAERAAARRGPRRARRGGGLMSSSPPRRSSPRAARTTTATRSTRYLATGGYDGLRTALTMHPEDVCAEVDAASPARARRRGLPGRAQVVDAAQVAGLVPRGQRRRVRAGDLQGPLPGRARPAPAHRGRGHRGLRPAGHAGLHLRARRVRPGARARPAGAQRRLRVRRGRARHPRARASASTSSCTRGPARTSAARRRPSSRRSRASAASRASSRRSSRP